MIELKQAINTDSSESEKTRGCLCESECEWVTWHAMPVDALDYLHISDSIKGMWS